MIYSNTNLKLKFKEFLKEKISSLQTKPVLNIIQIGSDLASSKYVEIKQKIGLEIGVEVLILHYQETPDRKEIQEIIEFSKANRQGLIFQLPVPIEFLDLVQNTPFQTDVDLLGLGSLKLWEKGYLPPTIGACDLILKEILEIKDEEFKAWSMVSDFDEFIKSKLDFSDKLVGVVGQGVLVGGPLLVYLKNRQATIISMNKFTKNPQTLSKQTDILLCGAGSPELINKNWLNPHAVIIDAATSEAENKLVGDVDLKNIFETNLLCPSPGGVGSITVLYLFYNLFKLNLD